MKPRAQACVSAPLRVQSAAGLSRRDLFHPPRKSRLVLFGFLLVTCKDYHIVSTNAIFHQSRATVFRYLCYKTGSKSPLSPIQVLPLEGIVYGTFRW